MSVSGLEQAIAEDRAAGRERIAVVASAGTVSTGAIDPLEPIAEICRANDLWLHVDGAYGALGALVAAEKFRGLNRANSLSVDLHKWFYQPVDCGLLLFQDPAVAKATFSHTDALGLPGPGRGLCFFEESLELSRRFRRAEGVAVAALPRTRGLSRRHPRRPGTRPTARRHHPGMS